MELDEVRRLKSELKYCDNEPVAGDIVLELCDDEKELIDEVKVLGKDLESFLDSNGFKPKAIVLFSACLCIWAANVGYLKPLVTVVNRSLKDGTRLEIVNGGEEKA